MEKNKVKQAEPLYYIEQPSFSNITGSGQTLSVRKKIGSKSNPKQEKKNKKIKQKSKQKKEKQSSEESNEFEEELKNEIEKEEEIEEADDEEQTEEPSKNVKEMLQYIETLPHFIQPVIACETKDKHLQGKLLYAENGEVVMQDRRNFSRIIVKDKDITDMYIVSL
ncbi:hypothetical protein ACE1TI_18295 [Alteribacillus sp. JSM 102045]|uniref:hypothetical protein n=1 Tax=Alteribacillus sp. JSM 102045 TaxID=1562101 RepID=UPI0035C2305D